MRRTSSPLVHPVLPWAWAGCSISLLLSGRARSDIASSLALIAASISIFLVATIPPHRKRIFRLGISLATFALAIRMVIALVIGVPMPGRLLFTLPTISLPDFIVGVRFGGPVTTDRIFSALRESLIFSAIVLALALANSINPPHNLLRALPYRMYGFGLATSIATSVTPQTASSINRVNRALRLRGDTSSGITRVRRLLTPILEESLERSLDLASALEVRGFGRGRRATRYRPERWTSAQSLPLVGIAVVALCLPILNLPPIGEFTLIFATLMIAVLS